MRSKTAEKGNTPAPRMEWYFDEVEKGRVSNDRKEKALRERKESAPHMEFYFDEITEEGQVICPVTGRKARVEVIRSASGENTPFVDVSYCSIFGCTPTCQKECLKRINLMKHFRK